MEVAGSRTFFERFVDVLVCCQGVSKVTVFVRKENYHVKTIDLFGFVCSGVVSGG